MLIFTRVKVVIAYFLYLRGPEMPDSVAVCIAGCVLLLLIIFKSEVFYACTIGADFLDDKSTLDAFSRVVLERVGVRHS
jgi:hypothetical protein